MIYIGILIIVVNPEGKPIQFVPFHDPEPREPKPGEVVMTCEVCGWSNIYQHMSAAKMGIASHRQWCKRKHR